MLALSIISNFTIFAGYIFIAVKVAPFFKLRFIATRISAILFFTTCSFTHLQMGIDAILHMPMEYNTWYYLLNHIVQAFAVWGFAVGIWVELILIPNREATKLAKKDAE